MSFVIGSKMLHRPSIHGKMFILEAVSMILLAHFEGYWTIHVSWSGNVMDEFFINH